VNQFHDSEQTMICQKPSFTKTLTILCVMKRMCNMFEAETEFLGAFAKLGNFEY